MRTIQHGRGAASMLLVLALLAHVVSIEMPSGHPSVLTAPHVTADAPAHPGSAREIITAQTYAPFPLTPHALVANQARVGTLAAAARRRPPPRARSHATRLRIVPPDGRDPF